MKKIIILICFLFTNSFVSAKLNIGNKSPGFILSDINGNRISVTAILADNKPIILAYFATWCQPCLKEIPHLQNIQSKSNVKVYLINIDGLNKEKIKEFLTKNNITFPVLLDPEAKITGENFEVLKAGRANIPKLFLISADGIIKYIKDGYDENIEKILAEQITAIEKENLNKPKELAIFFSNSSNGYLESCDCPTHPYGGLVRRATYLKQQREKYANNLALDSGDFLPLYASDAIADLIFKIYEIMNYDAICIGDQELSYEKFVSYINKYKLAFLSSNVNYCEGKNCIFLTPHDKIIEREGLRIKLLSITHPDVFTLFPEKITKKLNILSTDDILSQTEKIDYDLLILISHSGFDIDKEIAEKFKNIDIIIGGHSQTLLQKPYKIGNTLIVQAGENCQNVGKLVLRFDDKKKITSYEHEITPLTKDIADHPQIRNMINDYKNAIKKK
ncbi:MAG: hypothetical protein A2474_06050 [Elusimicrobia bacterium RIFOXYC2_FULL_34_12]|nr:MAG: hypothetical protein A2474_06050 [Elusimicrobia bacterium RIFOXYC2_FULL_34_12]OGS37853.1 MAG: hypothetical protein A2551_02035 [Elusimicrobia bacterium RIFOXYD2_FULL_34_30]HAM39176.1 hypothetical protein [Elusimicrobiota bacterium]